MRSPDPAVLERPPAPAEPEEETRNVRSWRLVALVAVLVLVGLWNPRVLLVIAAIAVIIFLHELGHYVMAKRAGMKVTEFFIGMGPRIWSFRRGETEYGLKVVPAVAYVRIVGMSNLDEVEPADEARTYRQGSYGARMGVALAGSAMHFLLAFVLAVGLFVFVGQRDPQRWEVDSASPGSAAATAGITAGDRIVSVDGTPVDTHEEMAEEVRRHPDDEIELVVVRGDERRTVPVRLGARSLIIGTVGEDISLASNDGFITVNSIAAGSRQAEAGLRDGDEVVAISGVPLGRLDDLAAALEASDGGRLEIEARRDGAVFSTTVDLGLDVAAVEPTGFLGVGQEQPPERLGVGEAVTESGKALGRVGGQAIVGIGKLFNPANLAELAGRLFTGDVEPAGPDEPTSARATSEQYLASQENRPVSIIGVVGLGSQTESLDQLLVFLASFNVIIGIINLIPLPPFDGGHVAIATYERVRELQRRDGRRYFADARKLMPVTLAVIMVMVTVGLLGVSLDIVSPLEI